MPKQTESQKIGSLGHSIVQQQIVRSPNWIARNLNEDYGIDIELELTEMEEVTGKFVKAQIKAHKSIAIKHSETLKKSYLRYVFECRVPIILIVICTETTQSWFVWLQKWIIDTDNVDTIYDDTNPNLSVSIDLNLDFEKGLEKEIISMAKWENKTQLYIAVKDLASLSLNLYDNDLANLLREYLELFHSGYNYDKKYFNDLIQKVIEMGTNIWATNGGNKLSRLLFSIIRNHGDNLNFEQIKKLVTRGEEISRTGLNALGILYDEFPEHVYSLSLPNNFSDFGDPRLVFYCALREQNKGETTMQILAGKELIQIGEVVLNLTGVDVLNKWANRGDSVILDYTYGINIT